MGDQLIFESVKSNKSIKEVSELDCFYLKKLIALLNKDDLDSVEIKFRENAKNTSYQSVVLIPKATLYRDSATSEIVFARLKTAGKTKYIAFPTQNKKILLAAGITPQNETKEDKKEDFIRLELDLLNQPTQPFTKAVNQIFSNSFSFQSFGCCSRYVQCSDAMKCIHPDKIYSKSCMYRKNLECGKIFYGVNKNT